MRSIVGLTCATCATSGTVGAAESVTTNTTQSSEWERLAVDDHPFAIRYRAGYEDDALRVREWATFAYRSVQDAYAHELDSPITFDLYTSEAWSNPPGNMVYNENERSASMLTPSEYDGGYEDEAMFYRHGVTHEYVHAVQKDALSFHTHANWMMEGFAEAVAVYYTDEEIHDAYHSNHSRAIETRRDIERGYGYLLGVNEYVYRGSMQLLEFMFGEWGSQAVGEIFEQDAENMIEAVEMRLEVDALELEARWLEYAQRVIGGDYTEQIERLGGTVRAFLSVDGGRTYEGDHVVVERAVYRGDGYVVVAFDETMTAVGSSDAFAAGEEASAVEIPLERDLAEPHRVTVRLHRATESGYGDPVEINGDRVSRTVMYSTSVASIRYSRPPADGDTSVWIDAHLGEAYETDGSVQAYVLPGDTTNPRDGINAEHRQVMAGTVTSGIGIALEESESAVPLAAGQDVTTILVDLDGDDVIAETTATVGDVGETTNQQSSDRAETDTTPSVATRTGTTDTAGTESDTPVETASDPVEDTATTGADGAGFGIGPALAGFGGLVGYLKRRDGDG